MFRSSLRSSLTLVALSPALLVACGKDAATRGPDPSAPSTTSTAKLPGGAGEVATKPSTVAAGSRGPLVDDFPSKDGSAWVNGAPLSISDARGDVVLVESWHRL